MVNNFDDNLFGNSSGFGSNFGGFQDSNQGQQGIPGGQQGQGGFNQPVNGFQQGASPFSGQSADSGFGGGSRQPKGSGKVKKVLAIIAGVTVTVGALGGGGYLYLQHQKEVQVQKAKEARERENLQSALKDAVTQFNLASVSDTESTDGVSVWDLNLTYVSLNNDRTDFVSRVARATTLTLDGSTGITVKSPNWEYVEWIIKNVDHDKIKELTKDLNPEAYTYTDDLINAFSKYLADNLLNMLEYKDTYVASYLTGTDVPQPYIETSLDSAVSGGKLTSDAVVQLDSLVYSSEKLHKSEDVFSAVVQDKYGEKTESKAHADWNARNEELTTYINNLRGYLSLKPKTVQRTVTADDGSKEQKEVDDPNTSDKLDNVTYDSAVSAWLELKKIEPTPYNYANGEANIEKVMPYGWVGSTYIVSKDSDVESSNVHMGSGKYDDPVTFGTPFVTKMQGTDGQYYDVRVTVSEIKVGDDAIKDVQTYNDKNNGFTNVSDLVLGTVKFKVENLTDKEIEVNSEFTLADPEQNLINRTGTMYGMPERAKIPARGVADMADWYYTKETKTLNLMWGKTFNHEHDAFYINVLGDELYDKYGRKLERNTKKIVENRAQADQQALERLAKEEAEERAKLDD